MGRLSILSANVTLLSFIVIPARALQHVHSHNTRVGSAVVSTAMCTRPAMQYSSISILHGSSATRAVRAASPPGAAAV